MSGVTDEKLLNEFRKEFPEIKIVGTMAPELAGYTQRLSESRAGQVLADSTAAGR